MRQNHFTKTALLAIAISCVIFIDSEAQARGGRARVQTIWTCDANGQNCKETSRPSPGANFLAWIIFLGGTGIWAYKNQQPIKEFIEKHQKPTASKSPPFQQKVISKSPKLPPLPDPLAKPEVAEWYVFRSGNAEGPYTRKQLQLEQKITARTNVRREGETGWTRAGEISKLANFLTTKA